MVVDVKVKEGWLVHGLRWWTYFGLKMVERLVVN